MRSQQHQEQDQPLVYVLYNGEHYKIGYSTEKNFNRRILNLSTGSNRKLEIIFIFHNDFARHIETRLHRKFKCNRVKGEWYWFDEKGLEEFQRVFELLKEGDL